jgi:hypothetical protein
MGYTVIHIVVGVVALLRLGLLFLRLSSAENRIAKGFIWKFEEGT